jgi:6-phosphogluconolactonase
MGTVGSANVSNVVVNCTTTNFAVGGSISGLTGTGLVVKDTTSGNSTTPVAANATSYAVDPSLASGTSYTLTVTTQPTNPTQSCTFAGNTSSITGTVGAGNASVPISCTTSPFTISGTISGLNGSGLVLKETTSGQVTAALNSPASSFTITGVNSGTAYSISVLTQPSTPTQFCRVTNATGTVTTANITGVSVKCLNVGQFLWVTNPFDNGTGSVASFAINQSTGALTNFANYVPTETNPYAVIADPSGLFIYVANQGSANVSTDGVGAAGALTLDVSTASTGASSNGPLSLAIDPVLPPAGPYLYVGSNDNPAGTMEAYTIGSGLSAGVLTPLGGALTPGTSVFPEGNVPTSLAFDPVNAFLYAANVDDGTIVGYLVQSSSTPAGELAPLSWSPQVASAAMTPAPFAVAVHPSGLYVYVTDKSNNTLTEYDASSSALTVANTYTTSSPVSVGTAPEGIAIDPTGNYLYVSNANDGTVSAYIISQTDGSLTAVTGSPFTSATGAGVPSAVATTAIAIDPSGQFLYVANGDAGSVTPFTIGAGGVLTPIGTANALTPVTTISGSGGPDSIAIF